MWPSAKLKFVARFGYGDALPTDEAQDGPFRVFGSNGPYTSFSRANTGAPAIVVGRKGSYGKVNWTPEPCFASDTTFFVDESTSRNDLRWIYWLLQTLRLDEGTDEAAVPGLNRESAYSRDVVVPPLPQQRAIAQYLDRETARLDALVAAKERVLGLLAEKRRALITRAVTRGLDPRAPLRAASIPWLGGIPAHWDVIPLKHACVLIKDGTHLPPERTMTGIPLLSVRNVVGETFRTLPDDSLIAEEDYEALCRGFRVEENDVLLAIVGATLGKVAVVGDMPRFHIQRSLATLRANPMLLDFSYLASCLRSDWFQTNLWESVSFSAQPGIYLGSLRDFVVTRPPIEEQRAIVAHVSAETDKLDAVRSATERTIALLEERRAALIAAAVTGKIDVWEAIA